MSTLRNLKLSVLRLSRSLGVFNLIQDTEWRRRQLLIVCYHGVSIDDEHRWRPGLYMSADAFEQRLVQLRRGGARVLPLGEAVRRLYEGTLPPRSVALTFDDGNYDFYSRAWPLLQKYDMPATVYLTTYYAEKGHPVFPLIISYLLWKRQGARGELRLSADASIVVDTTTASGRERALNAIVSHARQTQMSSAEQDALAADLARTLGIDYDLIRRRRIVQIMRPDEVREVSASGIDVQLHTHRHRSPLHREAYRAEIALNRDRVQAWAGGDARHFCYPSGVCMPQFEQWLEEEDVISATTCMPGMATRKSRALRLPRLLDHSEMTPLEFDAWLSGVGGLLPARGVGFTPVDTDGLAIVQQELPKTAGASQSKAGSDSPTAYV